MQDGSMNRKCTMSVAASPNCIAKLGVNLFLLDYEYSVYVNKVTETGLVKKVKAHESPLVLSNTYQTNPLSRQNY